MNIGPEGDPYERLGSWIGAADSPWTQYSSELVGKTVLVDFEARHWDRLHTEILDQPGYWQHRCAAALGEYRTDRAIGIFKLLLARSHHRYVRIEAVYQLDWADVPIESDHAPFIRTLIATTPVAEIEPEFYSLLAKADAAER